MSHKMGKGKERRRSQLNNNTTGETRSQSMKQNNGQYRYEFGEGSNMGKKEVRNNNAKSPMMTNGNMVAPNNTMKRARNNNYQYEFSKEPVAGEGQRITNRKVNQKVSDRANLNTSRYETEFGEDSSLRGTGQPMSANRQKNTTMNTARRNKSNATFNKYQNEFGESNASQSLQDQARLTKQKYQAAERDFKATNQSKLYNEEYANENQANRNSKYQTSTQNYDAANRYKEEIAKETMATGYGQSSGYMQSGRLMKSSLPSNKYNEEFGQDSYGNRTNKNLANRKSKVRTPSYGESYNYDQISSTYKRGNRNFNVEFGEDDPYGNRDKALAFDQSPDETLSFINHGENISSKATELANKYSEEYAVDDVEKNPRTLKEKMQSDEYVGKSQRGLYNTNKNYKAEFAQESPRSMFTAGKQVAAEKFKQKFQDNLKQNYNVEIAKENLIDKDENDEK